MEESIGKIKMLYETCQKITTEDFHEEYFNEYENALREFWGGQEHSYSNGFEDETYNYRQLTNFFGKNIIAEEQEAETKIKDVWKDDEDIGFRYSHVRSLREFTFHTTFISIHSTYEGRLKEYCIKLKYFGKATVVFDKRDNSSGMLNKIKKTLRLSNDTKAKNKLRLFRIDIRNTLVHHKGYLNSLNDAKIVSEIGLNKSLVLVKSLVGHYDSRIKIAKSNLLTDYHSVIEEDLKTIYRAAINL